MNCKDYTAIKYNLEISVNKTKAIAMRGKINVKTKIITNNNIIGKENSCYYLGYKITASNSKNLEIKVNRYNQMCSKI
jgi:hypothetical protein